MRALLPAFALLLTASCATRQMGSVLVPRANAASTDWVDLRPQMELRIENALGLYRECAGVMQLGTR